MKCLKSLVKGRKMAKKKAGKKLRVVRTSKGSYITNKKEPKKLSQKQLIKAIAKLMTRVDTVAMDELLEKQVQARNKFIEEHSEQWAKDRAAMKTDFPHVKEKAHIDLNEEKMNNAITMIRERISQIETNSDSNTNRAILLDIYKKISECFSICETILVESQ